MAVYLRNVFLGQSEYICCAELNARISKCKGRLFDKVEFGGPSRLYGWMVMDDCVC